MDINSKIYLAGHTGMIGTEMLNKLTGEGYNNIIYESIENLDLRDQQSVNEFFKVQKPEYVFLIAGKVGGIQANIKYPATFLYDNLLINSNVIHAAKENKVKKLLFLGSSCIYPRLSKQPMKEEYLLTGKLEPTNEGYAIGKIAGIKLCEYYSKQFGSNFISVIPPNLFGIGDNFKDDDSHVISALIKKFHLAKINHMPAVTIWGTGVARREFLFASDLVDGLLFLMENYNEPEPINIGSNKDISIKELALLIKKITNYEGELKWDSAKPDGMPKKLMSSDKINNLGWKPNLSVEEGLKITYEWYKK